MCRYMVLVPGANEALCKRDNLADAINMAIRWKFQLRAVVVVVDNTTGEIMWGADDLLKGYTRPGNPCMRHYQGIKWIKRYVKNGNLYAAIFQSGAVFGRIIDDTSLTKSEREKLLSKFHAVERQCGLTALHN